MPNGQQHEPGWWQQAIGGVGAVVSAIGAVVTITRSKRMLAAKASVDEATAEKTTADADVSVAGAAMQLVAVLQGQLERLEKRVGDLEAEKQDWLLQNSLLAARCERLEQANRYQGTILKTVMRKAGMNEDPKVTELAALGWMDLDN